MTGADYIVDYLVQKGVTDVFGIPGGVILDLLYAIDRQTPRISAHLCYHEQAASFAACGYAQASGKVGVAYATRGPGITNMITGIVDAYCDSIPVIFITAHSSKHENGAMRVETEQEIDVTTMLRTVTKYSAKVERIEDIKEEIERAYFCAVSGRKGPVFLDFATSALAGEIVGKEEQDSFVEVSRHDSAKDIYECIVNALKEAKRPVMLIGDGIRQSDTVFLFEQMAERFNIPILSSRFAQDIIPDSNLYFGYIGSHGIRYSNFILSKADLIISLGNRMAFPVQSKSFKTIVENAKTIRIDIDEAEFLREIPYSITYAADLAEVIPCLANGDEICVDNEKWIADCNQLKAALLDCDINVPTQIICEVLRMIDKNALIVCDVGNNEFWVSRAYERAGVNNRVLYSKSYGTLGCSLTKAIGAYYATKRPVVCFVGDQGFQFNIQELQYVAYYKLPIVIILLNNFSSGMIRSKEKQRFTNQFLHTTIGSGYSVPDFCEIVKAYGIDYYFYENINVADIKVVLTCVSSPLLVEIQIDEDVDLEPNLPKGNPCQKLEPMLASDLYESLDKL